jgi:hypothetical protein
MMEDDYTVFHVTVFYVGEEMELFLNIDQVVSWCPASIY